MYIPLKQFQKKTHFTGDVSINWATGRRGQAKLLYTRQVTQVNLPCKESGKEEKQVLKYFGPSSRTGTIFVP